MKPLYHVPAFAILSKKQFILCFYKYGSLSLRNAAALIFRSPYSVKAFKISEVEQCEHYLTEQPVNVQGSIDSRITYNSWLEEYRVSCGYYAKKRIQESIKYQVKKEAYNNSIPVIVQKILKLDDDQQVQQSHCASTGSAAEEIIKESFPFQKVESDVNTVDSRARNEVPIDWTEETVSVAEDIKYRLDLFDRGILDDEDVRIFSHDHEGDILRKIRSEEESVFHCADSGKYVYGTADKSVARSPVPCSGCGADLHCQDSGLPGFVPKELFAGKVTSELRAILCQRCFFLKHHQMALNVRVSPGVYLKVLEPIKNEKALVIIVVDLMDVPCSFWPGFLDIIGTQRPIFIVGNKVDLLPADGDDYLEDVKTSFVACIENSHLSRANILHVELVSAVTGYGIESLITKIQCDWGTQGNIYIMGCTNAGKSSLFNALLGSDLCKSKATDLIQRATTSPWPGTTLNMLKFPLMRPSGKRLHQRFRRLKAAQELDNVMRSQLPKTTKDIKVATLSGIIGQTFSERYARDPHGMGDPFSIRTKKITNEVPVYPGINPEAERWAKGKWCYDTPGTVHPDQFINLLSHDELVKVLPRHLVVPRSYILKCGMCLLIGGIARLDLLWSPHSVKFTVFASSLLPVTVAATVHASSLYRKYLGTELFAVPMGSPERLKEWPLLKPKTVMLTGCGKSSCADVVLSSAGWAAVTGFAAEDIDLRAWTPGGRGIQARIPPLLSNAVTLRGSRIKGTPVYEPHTLLTPRKAHVIFK